MLRFIGTIIPYITANLKAALQDTMSWTNSGFFNGLFQKYKFFNTTKTSLALVDKRGFYMAMGYKKDIFGCFAYEFEP